MIDLRSDTVTRPTAAMREAMAHAELGDDVFGEDPTVRMLEERVARLFEHEAAVFCPSGTMTNQIAINVHTRPGDEVICDEGAHVYRYEGGGTMANSGCSVRLVAGDRGRFTAAQVAAAIGNPADAHQARSRLVVVENTANRGGGSIWDPEAVRGIRAVCDGHGLALHLDGARIFNAMAEDGTAPAQWGALFHSVSVCMSKGLGAPVGSVLVGTAPFVHEARRRRKRFGGGMRQAGMLAAAGLYALDHHVQRLKEDHARARRLGDALHGMPWCAGVLPVATNIVLYRLRNAADARQHVEALRNKGVLCFATGPDQVRMVTHLHITDADVDRVIEALERIAT